MSAAFVQMMSCQVLLAEPNPEDPLVPEIANMFRFHERNVLSHTIELWSGTKGRSFKRKPKWWQRSTQEKKEEERKWQKQKENVRMTGEGKRKSKYEREQICDSKMYSQTECKSSKNVVLTPKLGKWSGKKPVFYGLFSKPPLGPPPPVWSFYG